MSSSLSFIPRKLTKSSNATKSTTATTRVSDTPQAQLAHSPPPIALAPVPPPQPTERDKPSKYTDTDYANLVALALSDYTLWVDSDLRQALDIGSQQSSSKDDEGFVPLDYLLERSAALASVLDERSSQESQTIRTRVQTALAKAIRTHASHLFDVRLLLHPDQIVPRFGKQSKIGGGYEIGRKRKGLTVRGKLGWDACTLYVENIPPGYRTYAGLIQFLNCILHGVSSSPSPSDLPVDPLTRVQGITFPLHHNDKPGARPSCKGFALVTFAHSSDCEYLLNQWPWFQTPKENVVETGQPESTEGKETNPIVEAMGEAHNHNFRTITKQRWLELKAEYLAYRQRLVDEINAHQDTQNRARAEAQQPREPGSSSTSQRNIDAPAAASKSQTAEESPSHMSIDPFAPYPLGCLVFVKHVHPETSKTTLRHLFAQALKQQDGAPVEGLDYVDFNKGMDTCYLRLAAPTYTSTLLNYFAQSGRQIVQVSGLDETGIDLSSASSSQNFLPITMQRVDGRPEEIYWEKVPVKVRKAAVDKAVKLSSTVDAPPGLVDSVGGDRKHRGVDDEKEGDDNSSRKKRRKRQG